MKRLALVLPLLLAACDSPTIPAREDTYPFELSLRIGDADTTVVFHWPVGSTIRYFVSGGAVATRAAALEAAADAAAADWSRAAIYGEYGLEPAATLADADILIRWSDEPLPVTNPDPVRCGIAGGRAVTTFCPAEDLSRLLVFPTTAGGAGRVRMIITIYYGEASDAEWLRSLVTHEMGHALGLWDHPDPIRFPGSVMLSSPGSTSPSAVDRATVQVLYQTPADIVP